MIEKAGATVLELNVYFWPPIPAMTATVAVEQRARPGCGGTRRRCRSRWPSRSPRISARCPTSVRCLTIAAPTDWSCSNAFLKEPDIDLETLSVAPHLVLSDSREIRLPLRWIAILRDAGQISLAGNGSIRSNGRCRQDAAGRSRRGDAGFQQRRVRRI